MKIAIEIYGKDGDADSTTAKDYGEKINSKNVEWISSTYKTLGTDFTQDELYLKFQLSDLPVISVDNEVVTLDHFKRTIDEVIIPQL